LLNPINDSPNQSSEVRLLNDSKKKIKSVIVQRNLYVKWNI